MNIYLICQNHSVNMAVHLNIKDHFLYFRFISEDCVVLESSLWIILCLSHQRCMSVHEAPGII